MTSTSVRDVYEGVSAPAVYGVTATGNHNSYGDLEDDPGYAGLEANDALESRGAITAWFEWRLKERAELERLFIGDDCGYCSSGNWQDTENRNF